MNTWSTGDGIFHADIWYPRVNEDDTIRAIQVGLVDDVRAADDILIEYDFERDGWSIKQAQVFEWPVEDEECNPQWKEVAFVAAWGSVKEDEDVV